MGSEPRLYWRVCEGDEVRYIPATSENSWGDFPNMTYLDGLVEVLEQVKQATVEITQELLDNGMSKNGSYSKAQRALLGIDPPWPPSIKPVKETIGDAITLENAMEFVRLKDMHLKEGTKTTTGVKMKSVEQNNQIDQNLLPDYYPEGAPTVFTRESGQKEVDRQKGNFDPAWDEPGGPKFQTPQKCPKCGSTEIKAVGTGGAECKSCGHVLS